MIKFVPKISVVCLQTMQPHLKLTSNNKIIIDSKTDILLNII
jgi:hypothetical protein